MACAEKTTNGSALAEAVMSAGGSPELWAHVDRLVDRAPREADLRAHGVHLLAAQRFRALGRPVSAQLEEDAWSAAVTSVGS